MAKIIIREMLILILLFIAIGLTLAIILYGYNPTKKVVPVKVEYSTPENIKEEISSSTDSETTSPVVVTYELDDAQINNLKKSGSYTSGKQNPFAKHVPEATGESEEGTEEGEQTKENNTSNSEGTVEKENNASSKNSSSTKNEVNYLPKTGTK